ncbi:hypothetical protein [Embleya scabrispora]|uniref:hypothetical protein n=1 Tax=Embleya scabrispora TaxID=159449 RepID=UPI000363F420|nr:hypothetical protein [Embleya scabrispora]MYS83038.1 hypothetical protein [Streptomyces sp. SID5474]
MPTVDPPPALSVGHGATLAICLVGAAVPGRVDPLALTVFLAQADGRCYAAVAFAVFPEWAALGGRPGVADTRGRGARAGRTHVRNRVQAAIVAYEAGTVD